MSNDTIQIGINVIVIGLVVGIIASLWNILPFFVPGLGNIFFTSMITAIILLVVFSKLKKDVIIKSGVFALIIFLLTSFAIVPVVSGIIINKEVDISKYTAQGFESVDLKLPGLFCEGCAYSAQNALKGIDGVADAKVNYNSKSGVVVYDPNKVNPEELVEIDLIKAYGGKIE